MVIVMMIVMMVVIVKVIVMMATMILIIVIMVRKRAENKRFRKKKDIDVINENDDAIAKMIADMRIAAKEDRDLNIEGKPGINKMKMFPVGKYLFSNLQTFVFKFTNISFQIYKYLF